MGITGAPEAMMVGGKTSSGGPAPGIYKVIVADASVGITGGDPAAGKAPRHYIELEFHGKGDKEHPAKDGKKVTKQRFYGAAASDDAEKKEMMLGMLRAKVYKGLGVKWPTGEAKPVDTRIFTKKECYIAIAPGKENPDTNEVRNEVQAISIDRAKLPKKFLAEGYFSAIKAEQKDNAPGEGGEESGEEAAPKAPAKRR
jgi:hypothetical protein